MGFQGFSNNMHMIIFSVLGPLPTGTTRTVGHRYGARTIAMANIVGEHGSIGRSRVRACWNNPCTGGQSEVAHRFPEVDSWSCVQPSRGSTKARRNPGSARNQGQRSQHFCRGETPVTKSRDAKPKSRGASQIPLLSGTSAKAARVRVSQRRCIESPVGGPIPSLP